MTPDRHSSKSGQAIIFLMVVLLVGLLVVIWNFDLHRVISTKLRMRDAADSAALAAARWQGKTLNMIGDLNLVQVALASDAYAEYLAALQAVDPDDPDESDPDFLDYLDLTTCEELHDLRKRLEFLGPVAAFAIAQQTALNNGAHPDPELASNLVAIADQIRFDIDNPPFNNAFKEYADLLDRIVENGAVVSSYFVKNQNHPLMQEEFYFAVAQAVGGWWCPFRDYRYELESYDGFESWGDLDVNWDERDTVLGTGFPFSLKMRYVPGGLRFLRFHDRSEDYWEELDEYLFLNPVINDYGYTDYAIYGIGEANDLNAIYWHAYGNNWEKRWARASFYDDKTGRSGGRFPLRSDVKSRYNYLGAEAGVSMSVKVGRGILASGTNDRLELVYKTKAKPFGMLKTDFGVVPPLYFGLVFPCFEDVRLIHSDIGDKMISEKFFRHVTEHLEGYLETGTEACVVSCDYCRLLKAWENLDYEKGVEWLEAADRDPENNPCDPDQEKMDDWGEAGGGATGGS